MKNLSLRDLIKENVIKNYTKIKLISYSNRRKDIMNTRRRLLEGEEILDRLIKK